MQSSGKNRKCTTCLGVFPVSHFYLYSDRSLKSGIRLSSKCRPCFQKSRRDAWALKKNTPFDAPLTSYLNHIYLKATYRTKVSFLKEALLDLWLKQKGICALTGWPMTTRRNNGRVKTNAPLDRIDSSLGYDLDNVQLVCASANRAKMELSEKDFVELCRAVSKKRGVRYGRRKQTSTGPKAKRRKAKAPSKTPRRGRDKQPS